jgi:hypothetical protein
MHMLQQSKGAEASGKDVLIASDGFTAKYMNQNAKKSVKHVFVAPYSFLRVGRVYSSHHSKFFKGSSSFPSVIVE